MKQGIHPNYTVNATVSCACGNSFQVGSTQPSLRVELCSTCHPFYTGKQNFVDTARRIEKFQDKAAKVSAAAQTRSKSEKEVARKSKRAEKKAAGK
ncbi:MAG: 50S ribosomal protein L31 [Candidatus Magasanikbacteria bacterium RIFCSPHIGHO2_01_FULL_50_8]|uniref:Large ribosomal subunit protein bL31 n=2 Tax=Candidatus Magasanikiibacteriota TaxID=1752731 RepID=A0A1F6LU18_9BACT|nr:MAG: 50S ribosomal protein L31 [Candidatus Magasanikbacteria bacterium RIFCSPHIGHO2_01_FULL_50_8]OGH67910.1 MAG: 50S ribosomal protein L31 [Candidatus Magasanikbacteria bacterium RIFCSPHIGHO2_02_FULL_50_9b]